MLNLGFLVFHGMISAQLPGNLTMLQYSTVNTGSFMMNKEFVPPPNALLLETQSLGPFASSMGGKYNDLVYTGMSIYQYIPVYTPGSYLLDLPLSFQ